jgi:uncharacterized DUF497 family protein
MADDGTSPLAVATGFNWDDGNAPKAVDRHGVEPGECEQAFFLEPFVVSYDGGRSMLERRWRALGQTAAGRRLLLVFTMRGTLIRVLAAREMNRKERRHYAEISTRTESDPHL